MTVTNEATLPLQLPDPGAGGRYLIAYSGGLDSTVLLHLMAASAHKAAVEAVHVHHGLQPAADRWSAHCEQQCLQLRVPYQLLRVTPLRAAGLGLEAAARRARYDALQGVMRPGDILLTAHHLDDQAETLLLQLLRGAGPRGLSAMPSISDFPPGLHVRPLLNYPRTRIEACANARNLDWVDDPSNRDTAHARNYLRHDVIPRLRQQWPDVATVLARSAALSAEASELLDQMAEDDFEWCTAPQSGALMIPALLQLSPIRRRNLLRAWIGWLGLPLPESRHLHLMDTQVLMAAQDATPLLAWPGVEVRRYREQLFATSPLEGPVAGWRADWSPPSGVPLELPARSGYLVPVVADTGMRLRQPGGDESVYVRLAQEGERLHLAGHRHHRTLKKLCQEAGVPSWLRRRLPVVMYGDEIAAVADRWICAGFDAENDEAGWRLLWRDPPLGYPGTWRASLPGDA